MKSLRKYVVLFILLGIFTLSLEVHAVVSVHVGTPYAFTYRPIRDFGDESAHVIDAEIGDQRDIYIVDGDLYMYEGEDV